MCSAASTSINSCSTIVTASRIRSTPSPARNASSRSDTADSDRAIGVGSPSCALGRTHRESRRWPTQLVDPADYLKPHHRRGRTLTLRALTRSGPLTLVVLISAVTISGRRAMADANRTSADLLPTNASSEAVDEEADHCGGGGG